MRARRILVVSTAALLWITPATLHATNDSRPEVAATTGHESPSPLGTDAGVPAGVSADSPALAVTIADPGQTQNWWQILIAELLNLVMVIFVPVLSTLIVTLLRRWKINVEFDQVNSIAKKAAGWAEQKAASALKEGHTKTPGAKKMDMAMRFANDLADRYKLSAKATDKLQDLIESSLGREKIKAKAAKAASQPDTVTA